MIERDFNSNDARTPSFFDGTTYIYGWKNSEPLASKDFKVLWDDLKIGGFTQGSVMFAGSDGLLSQDNNNLFWDDTLNRLGIGNSSPASFLDVVGDGVNQIFSIRETGGGSVLSVNASNQVDIGFTNQQVRINSHDITGGIASFTPIGASGVISAQLDIKGAVPSGTAQKGVRITTTAFREGQVEFFRQDSNRGLFQALGNTNQGVQFTPSNGGALQFRITNNADPATQTDSAALYSKDANGVGTSALFTRSENGKIVRLYPALNWATATGTANRATFDTSTVTLPQLAERLKALIDDLYSGNIGLLDS